MVNDFLNVALQFAPLLAILLFANWGERLRQRDVPYMAPVVVSYAATALLYIAAFVFGLIFLLTATMPAAPIPIESPAWLVFGVLVPSVIGLLLLLKPARRLVARFTNLEPDHPVHTVALALTMTPILNLGLTLGIGLETLTNLISQQAEQTGMAPISLASLWAQNTMFVLMALIGVGWLTRRTFGESLRRLGIVRPGGRDILIGVTAALVLIPVIPILLGLLGNAGMGVDQDVESLTEVLTGALFATPLGILSVGLAPAIGEESIFRGAMQPRFGLLLTSILFALVHGQYGLSLATLVVFGLGLVLGIVRNRTNTTTSMLTHALYNSGTALLAYLGIQFLSQQRP
jgi:membrane protease YdiL (CAAX protease family)